jgi:hypothetical protein
MIMRNEEALEHYHRAPRIGYNYRAGYILGTKHRIASHLVDHCITVKCTFQFRINILLHMLVASVNG